jgi:hypothetical protein
VSIVDDEYRDTIEYLRTYAAGDWLELSTVAVWANGVTGRGSSTAEIVDMTLRLAGDLLADGSVPGEVVDDDRGFVPWPGDPTAQLDRLRAELADFVAGDRLPEGFDVCWFHKISP